MKKNLVFMIIGMIIMCGIVYAADVLMDSKSISYSSEYTDKDNVSDAISELLEDAGKKNAAIYYDEFRYNGYPNDYYSHHILDIENDTMQEIRSKVIENDYFKTVESSGYTVNFIAKQKLKVKAFGTMPSINTMNETFILNVGDSFNMTGYGGTILIVYRN